MTRAVVEDLSTAGDITVAEALAFAGRDERLRDALFDALREAEARADRPANFRERVRWPLILGLLEEVGSHRIVLSNGLIYEVGPDSRIERSLLLSPTAHPDHVWEPQTTKLLVALARGASHVIVGGAYIGDHVLPIARELASQAPPGLVHSFEPMGLAYGRLLRNLELNAITNVVPECLGLWDKSDLTLNISGPAALASSLPSVDQADERDQTSRSVTIDDYLRSREIADVGLVMLDIEGGEERALYGARGLLSRPRPEAPHLVFEVHRSYVDWSDGLQNTPVVKYLSSFGYATYAIRDFHDNYPMGGMPIEIIPVNQIYLEGPAHGFNMLATMESDLIDRLDLRVVRGVSPKLLPHKDPALHHPLNGLV